MIPGWATKRRTGWAAAVVLAAGAIAFAVPSVAPAMAPPPQRSRTGSAAIDAAGLTLQDISPGFLGLYRKVMEIEDRIRRHATTYGLDYDLARAVCLYESGGNARLTSWAGAEGYFQVMPATQRTLGVDDNIEAGIKYLAQLVERFEREDYALAGYNGGPASVGRRRPMRLESLQYVLGVGHYRMILKLYEEPIRRFASELDIEVAGEDDTWWTVSQRLGIPLLQLRLYNPYIGIRDLEPGFLVAHPAAPRADLYEIDDDAIYYRSRIGDNYFLVAFAFDIELDALRDENQLWHLQTLPPGMELRLPLFWTPDGPEDEETEEEEAEVVQHTVSAGQSIPSITALFQTSEWRIIRDNFLWDERVPPPGTVLDITLEREEPQFTSHTVRRGENLTVIAHRYGTSVRAIQDANSMGNRTVIRIGQQLLVPAR